jgi:hypothetical protein
MGIIKLSELETIPIEEFAEIILDFFMKKEYISTKYITSKRLFKELTDIEKDTAGRKDWITFRQLFSEARGYLRRPNSKNKVYIQAKKFPIIIGKTTDGKDRYKEIQGEKGTEIVKEIGYSISQKDFDFLDNNKHILEPQKDRIVAGIEKNKQEAELVRTQKKITNYQTT